MDSAEKSPSQVNMRDFNTDGRSTYSSTQVAHLGLRGQSAATGPTYPGDRPKSGVDATALPPHSKVLAVTAPAFKFHSTENSG